MAQTDIRPPALLMWQTKCSKRGTCAHNWSLLKGDQIKMSGWLIFPCLVTWWQIERGRAGWCHTHNVYCISLHLSSHSARHTNNPHLLNIDWSPYGCLVLQLPWLSPSPEYVKKKGRPVRQNFFCKITNSYFEINQNAKRECWVSRPAKAPQISVLTCWVSQVAYLLCKENESLKRTRPECRIVAKDWVFQVLMFCHWEHLNNASRVGRYDVLMMQSDSLIWCHDNELYSLNYRQTDWLTIAVISIVTFATKSVFDIALYEVWPWPSLVSVGGTLLMINSPSSRES